MKRKYSYPAPIIEFGSLNTQGEPNEIAANEAQLLENFDFTAAKGIRKRAPVTSLGGSPTPFSAGNSYRLLGADGTYAYWSDNTAVIRTLLDGTLPTVITDGGLALTKRVIGLPFNNAFAMLPYDPNLSLKYVNPGATASSTGTVFGGYGFTYAVVFKERIFAFSSDPGGAVGNNSILRYSQVNDLVTAWPATNFMNVGMGDGDFLTSMIVYQDALYVFKNKSLWVLSGDSPSNFLLRKVHSYLGCAGRRTPQVINELLYFLSNEGVYSTDGTSFNEMSAPIRDYISNFSVKDWVTIEYTESVYWDNKYIITFHNSSIWFVYDLEHEQWSTWNTSLAGIVPRGFVPREDLQTSYIILSSTSSAELFKMNPSSYSTTVGERRDKNGAIFYSIAAYWKGKLDFYDQPTEYKRHMFTAIQAIFDTVGSAELEITTDGNGYTFTDLRSDGGHANPTTTRVPGVGRFSYMTKFIRDMGPNSLEVYSIWDALMPGEIKAHNI